MTLEETIQHCKDVANSTEYEQECKDRHLQLATWLSELKDFNDTAILCGWSEEVNCTPATWVDNIIRKYYEIDE